MFDKNNTFAVRCNNISELIDVLTVFEQNGICWNRGGSSMSYIPETIEKDFVYILFNSRRWSDAEYCRLTFYTGEFSNDYYSKITKYSCEDFLKACGVTQDCDTSFIDDFETVILGNIQ